MTGSTGLTAACPDGRSVLFGFAQQVSTAEPGTEACLAGAQVACQYGATSCTQPSCVTAGVDQAALFLACAPLGYLGTSTLQLDAAGDGSTALAVACPVGYTLGYGQARHVALQLGSCVAGNTHGCGGFGVPGCGTVACNATEVPGWVAVQAMCFPDAVAYPVFEYTAKGLTAETLYTLEVSAVGFGWHNSC